MPSSSPNDNQELSDISVLSACASLGDDGSEYPPVGFLRRLGRYTLQRSIGRGGFGEVFQAFDNDKLMLVAIKVLAKARRADPIARARFEQEIRIGREFAHPNILHVIDADLGNEPYFVTPLIDGPNLLHWLGKHPTSVPEAVRLVRTMSEAVHHAHTKGYLHRDLKPANILIERKTLQPYLADFGLAKSLDQPSGLTDTLDVVGTLGYMPPEQADPHLGEFSPATDVYGLGATLYELLTGRPPFPRIDRGHRDLSTQVIWDAPLPPSKHKPDIPTALDTICLLCLQKSPHDRYASTAELAADLRRFEQGKPIEARLPNLAKRVYRRCRRQPYHTLALATAACLAIAGGIAARYYAFDAQDKTKRLVGAESQTNAARAGEAAARMSERTQAYVSDLRDARLHWKEHELPELKKVLGKYDKLDTRDLRNIEWYYLHQRLGANARSVSLDFVPQVAQLTDDGSRVAVAGSGRVQVFDCESGREVFRGDITSAGDKALAPSASAVVFSPSSFLVAATCRAGSSESREGYLKVWDTRTGKAVFSIEDQDIGGEAVAISSDDQSVVVAGNGEGWQAWDIQMAQKKGRGLEGSLRQRPAKDSRNVNREESGVPRSLRFVDATTLILATQSTSTVWSWPESRDVASSVGVRHQLGGWPIALGERTVMLSMPPRVGMREEETLPTPKRGGGTPLPTQQPQSLQQSAASSMLKGSNGFSVTKTELSRTSQRAIPPGEIALHAPYKVNVIAIAPGRIAAHCDDGVLRTWTLDRNWCAVGVPCDLSGGPTQCRGVAASRSTVAALSGNSLVLWSIEPVAAAEPTTAVVSSDLGLWGQSSNSGRLIATPKFGRRQTMLHIRRASESDAFAQIDLGVGTPLECVFSDDERFLYVRIFNKAVVPGGKSDLQRPSRQEVWELAGPRLVTSLPVPSAGTTRQTDAVPSIQRGGESAVFDCQRGLVFVVLNGNIRRIQLANAEYKDFESPFAVGAISLSPAGRLLGATGEGCGVLNLEAERWLWNKPIPSVQSVFHRIEKYVVIQSTLNEPGVSAFDCVSGAELSPLFKNEKASRFVFSMDRSRVFAISRDALRMYSLDENPGTLMLETKDIDVPDSAKLDLTFVRTLEHQLTGK